jgi:GTP:adenosylcobinamide-phosphate guanylyltransferase
MDVIVPAGGRISGGFARASGETVKAAVVVAGKTLLTRVVEALAGAKGIDRICVVGPQQLQALTPPPAVWVPDGTDALENLLNGLDRLGLHGSDRFMVCASDLPMLTAAAVGDFLERMPDNVDIIQPLVERDRFRTQFPGDMELFIRLQEGYFLGGAQFVLRAGKVRENLELLRSLHYRRKSQLAMAAAIGWRFVAKLVTGRLSLSELEARGEELTGCRCRAVRYCHPELAFDIDNRVSWHYAERYVRRPSSQASFL